MKKAVLLFISLVAFMVNTYAEEVTMPTEDKKEVSLVNCLSATNSWYEVDGKVKRIRLLAFDSEDGEISKEIDEYACSLLKEAKKIEIEYDIKALKKDAKKAKKIFIATDPDREGEAIAWHLAKILEENKEKITRVTFNEITKTAVQKAIKEPRDIDRDTVDAQQARRVLDRIVGYKISPVLWKKVKRGLSAGRVQSVAVKLICEREEEIENFIPEEYWNITAILSDGKTKKTFESKLIAKNKKKIELHSKEDVDNVLNDINLLKICGKEE